VYIAFLTARDLLGTENIRARVVSMPSRELFDAQDPAYQQSVLPPAVTPRVSPSISGSKRSMWQPPPKAPSAARRAASFDQYDPRLTRADMAEVLAQILMCEFSDRAGQFHACRPAANDHKGEQYEAISEGFVAGGPGFEP
jgi:hypothetical protein